jgi:ligand-binding sensor domain-containing protein
MSQIVRTFKGDRFTHYTLEDWISYAPALNINSIDTDEKYVYFATQKGGILRFDKYSEEWEFPYTTSSGLRSNNVYNIVYNQYDGYLYARTPYGVDVLKYGENYWQKHSNNKMPQKRQPQLSEISDLQKGKDFRFPPFFRPGNDFFPNFFTERSIMYIPPDQILDSENREYNFTDRMIDEWQRLWLGTNGFGPMQADMTTFSLSSQLQGIPNISTRDIYLDENNVWIGGFPNSKGIAGITLWDSYNDNWQYFEAQFYSGIARDDILAIDGNKRFIVFATIYGVVVFDKNKSKWKTYSQLEGLEGDMVNDVLVEKNTAYVATEHGFNWFDLKSKRVEGFTGSAIDNVEINQLTVFQDTLYLATQHGLYSVDIKDMNVKFQASRAAIPDFNLTAIAANDTEIWFANDYGISYINKPKKSWFSFADLSIKPEIRDIDFTNEAVWFATSKGLMKYDREMNDWRLFTTADGLIDNNVYHIDIENDNLWLSTEKGFTIFNYNKPGRLD